MKSLKFLAVLLLVSTKLLMAQMPLNFGSIGWKYFSNVVYTGPDDYNTGTSAGIVNWTSPLYNTFVPAGWDNSPSNILPLGYKAGSSSYAATVPFSSTAQIPYGSDATQKPLVTYYRKSIVVDIANGGHNLADYSSFNLKLKADDGAVVYFNGAEVYRVNLPSGVITNSTPVINPNINETNFWWPSSSISHNIPNGSFPLHPTINTITITVEIHQGANSTTTLPAYTTSSSDSFFDIELTGVVGPLTPAITRGPYLQLANDGTTANSRPSEITKQIRWTTNLAAVGVVKIWKSTDLPSTATVWTGVSTNDHIINITGLIPNTKYFYEIGVNNPAFTSLEVGPNNYFVTGPITAAQVKSKKTRIWVTGDAGYSQNGDVDYPNPGMPYAPTATNYNEVQSSVLTGFNNWMTANGNPQLDFWMLLGDNAYLNGTNSEYQNYFFNPFQGSKMMKQATIFSCPGNHDYYESRGSGLKNSIRNSIPYSYTNIYPGIGPSTDIVDANSRNYSFFEIFQNLEKGQSGGVPSNAKGYYSFNYGNIHFVSLDSYGSEGNVKLSETLASAQKSWLMADLTANDANPSIKWTVVIFHHPPYTKGSYDSDTRKELLDLANNLVPVFEAHKVDLVLNGHSHVYERSKQLKNLFGSPTFLPHANFNASTHNINSSSGKFDGSSDSCPYVTTSSNTASVNGIVYAIVGSSSTVQSSSTISSLSGHHAMPFKDYTNGGTMLLEIENNRLDAKFINELGNVGDQFTILKDVSTSSPITKLISPNELPIQTPDLQILPSPTWSGITNFTISGPTISSATPFSGASVPVSTPEVGPVYTIKDATGCLSQTYKFLFDGFCWPDITIKNTIDTPIYQQISSTGRITAKNLIRLGSNVMYRSRYAINLNHNGVSGPPLFEVQQSPLIPTRFQALIIPTILSTCPAIFVPPLSPTE
ncbi:metallophosphoesterase family protein [Lacihabitans soyangensis]|uniref:Calcineurin-like phosphoesterase domain-containing protein n=1 Tax=Lacihabitans soyangensis TaxID=869394 RepID=A0AAE3KS05_9BACT|nr:metallophosphoesterase [Lacihabitans soyangensis]MCP9762772.1 hypothetical protein [Lacihabitans soyangensis]